MTQRHELGLDIKEFEAELLEMTHRAPLVLSRALNRALVSGKTQMARETARDTGFGYSAIVKDIKVETATRLSPVAAFYIMGSRIPVIALAARGPEPSKGRGRGVSWKSGGSRTAARNAFIAKVGIGQHRGVFSKDRRRGASSRMSKGAWSPNLPIRELFGPSIPHVMEKFVPSFFRAAQESITKNLRREIAFERSKSTK
jgi:hypothetical protein